MRYVNMQTYLLLYILKKLLFSQDRIIARLQQPYSLDCIPVEAEYQVCSSTFANSQMHMFFERIILVEKNILGQVLTMIEQSTSWYNECFSIYEKLWNGWFSLLILWSIKEQNMCIYLKGSKWMGWSRNSRTSEWIGWETLGLSKYTFSKNTFEIYIMLSWLIRRILLWF